MDDDVEMADVGAEDVNDHESSSLLEASHLTRTEFSTLEWLQLMLPRDLHQPRAHSNELASSSWMTLSVSIENTLAALLPRTMPDLTPNPRLYLNGSRRPTLEDIVRELYDQWHALLLFCWTSLLAFHAPCFPSSSSSAAAGTAEPLACKTLQILTALANHNLRTVLNFPNDP